MKICVYGAASSLIAQSYKDAAKDLGKKIAKRGDSLVFGGGANGVMGAVAEGVYEEKGHILGVVPKFFKEANSEVSFKKCSEYIYTDTMRERKCEMEKNCDAFIIAPGGIGTLDEFFEILTLKQLGRHNKAIVLFNINGFYDELDTMMTKSIEEECKELYKVLDNADGILDYIEQYDPKDIDLSKVKIR